jgi:hypothetical protein
MEMKLGYFEGKPYYDYPSSINELLGNGNTDEAVKILYGLIDVIETEANINKSGVAPWYYEKLAIIFHKKKEYDKEIEILERFALQRHSPGVKPARLIERLNKAKTKD